jgi:NAD(P)-dependent dehydrogenase (short-subunit alcohol dehydrogenase family)
MTRRRRHGRGASGFGLALATHCASRGYDVALYDRDAERVRVAAEQLGTAHGVRVLGGQVDVAVPDEVDGAAAEVTAELGRCDLLFSNVGVQHFGAVESVPDDVWRWVLDVNVIGSARTARAFLPLLRATPGARLVFTASANVLGPAARLGAYQASKAAVVALAETLRLELVDDDVAVSVVYPSGMITRHLESSAAARPAALGPAAPGGVDAADRAAMMASRPMTELDLASAEDAAAHALAGVLAGEAHVITHGELSGPVTRHVEELHRALEQVARRQPGPTATRGQDPVDDLEAIKQLKARYFRLLDTKDWDGWRQVLADDVVVDTTGAGGSQVEGADAFVAYVRASLEDARTVHHGHAPEITLTSPTTATGIWALHDKITWPDGTDLEGFGHYHETYEKRGDAWCITSSRLTRLRVDLTGPRTADS